MPKPFTIHLSEMQLSLLHRIVHEATATHQSQGLTYSAMQLMDLWLDLDQILDEYERGEAV